MSYEAFFVILFRFVTILKIVYSMYIVCSGFRYSFSIRYHCKIVYSMYNSIALAGSTECTFEVVGSTKCTFEAD